MLGFHLYLLLEGLGDLLDLLLGFNGFRLGLGVYLLGLWGFMGLWMLFCLNLYLLCYRWRLFFANLLHSLIRHHDQILNLLHLFCQLILITGKGRYPILDLKLPLILALKHLILIILVRFGLTVFKVHLIIFLHSERPSIISFRHKGGMRFDWFWGFSKLLRLFLLFWLLRFFCLLRFG